MVLSTRLNNPTGDPKSRWPHFRLPLVVSFLLVALIGLGLAGCASTESSHHQTMIHDMGAAVMPFDLDKTLHIFDMIESGGIQQVVLRNPKDSDQLPLIRSHMEHEAMRFASGDFSDPIALHGKNMPGVRELEADASKLRVSYSEVPEGAQIVFETADIRLITAIHRWFGAQLSDHGSDATYR